jgi:hypothetical protein
MPNALSTATVILICLSESHPGWRKADRFIQLGIWGKLRMRAGRLDRRILIERQSITQSDSGEHVISWQVATVYAEKRESEG